MKAVKEEKTVEVTIRLTPRQIKEAYLQLLRKQTGGDWLDDPEILELLAKREARVTKEIKKGQFTTLRDLQAKLSRG